MPAESKTAGLVIRALQPGPTSNVRVLTIGANHPTAADFLSRDRSPTVADAVYSLSPQHPDAYLVCTIQQEPMQTNPADANSSPGWETCLNGDAIVQESNASERSGLIRADGDSELLERRQRIGHESFAAGLLDRRLGGVGYRDIKSFEPGRDGGCQARRPASYHENIRRPWNGNQLPPQQHQFGAEARTHRGQQAVSSGRGTPLGHDFF